MAVKSHCVIIISMHFLSFDLFVIFPINIYVSLMFMLISCIDGILWIFIKIKWIRLEPRFSLSKSTLLPWKWKLCSVVPFEVSERLILSLFLSVISQKSRGAIPGNEEWKSVQRRKKSETSFHSCLLVCVAVKLCYVN